jgi:hypothetical protein
MRRPCVPNRRAGANIRLMLSLSKHEAFHRPDRLSPQAPRTLRLNPLVERSLCEAAVVKDGAKRRRVAAAKGGP